MSPDVFLSRAGYNYSGTGLPGTPAEIVKALTTLNHTRIWQEGDEPGFVWNLYTTPGFIPAPYGPTSLSPETAELERQAVRVYEVAVKSGDLPRVYAAVDAINAVRAAKGGIGFRPWIDFELLAEAQNYTGDVARWLKSDRLRAQETGASEPFFFTHFGYSALVDYEAASKPVVVAVAPVKPKTPKAPKKPKAKKA